MLGPDGEKYACEACIRGHRVSNCNHADRELKHIAKKGRPVTQCTHCRSLRKSRSAHVKCDCGEKQHAPKEKCCHLKHAQTANNGTPPALERHPSDGHCCHCHHGERCTCALKKDPSDLPALTEDHPMPPPVARARPKLFGAHTDNNLMVVTNGHHKPIHRNNNAAHECGMPYKIPPHHNGGGHGLHGIGHRSSDSLPLNFSTERNGSSTPVDSMMEDNFFNQSSTPSQIQPTSAPLATAASDFSTSQPNSSPFASMGMNQPGSADAFNEPWNSASSQANDMDMISSAGTEFPSNLWSGNDLPLMQTVSNASQPPSWTTESNGLFPQPALTAASSSGPQSEIDESLPVTLDELYTPLTSMSNTAKDQPMATSNQKFVPDEVFPNFDMQLSPEGDEKSNNRWSMPIGSFNLDGMQQGFVAGFRRPSTHVRSGSNPIPPGRPASIHALDQYDAKAPTSNPGFTSANNNWLAQLGLDIPSNAINTNLTNTFTGIDLNNTSQIAKMRSAADGDFGATQMPFTSSCADFGTTNATVTDSSFSFDGSAMPSASYGSDGWGS